MFLDTTSLSRSLHLLSSRTYRRGLGLAGSFVLTAGVVSAQPVQLTQVRPDVDPGAGSRIVLEKVADPGDPRGALVNFNFELDNISANPLELRGMTFTYLGDQQNVLHEERVSPDEIAQLMIRSSTSVGGWTFEGQNPTLIELPWSQFLADWQALETEGFRLTDLEIDRGGGQALFSGVFERGTHGPAAVVGKPWAAFLADWQSLESQGQRMIDIETYLSADGRTRLYAGIFKPDTYAPVALIGRTWSDFQSAWSTHEAAGYRMFDIETYVSRGVRLYSGLMKPGAHPPAALVGQAWSDFLTGWQGFEAQGLRLVDLETYEDGGGVVRFTGLFEPGSYAPKAVLHRPLATFADVLAEAEDDGYRLFELEARRDGGEPLYSGIFAPGPAISWRPGIGILFMAPQAEFDRRWPVEVRVEVRFDNAPSFSFELPIEVYRNTTAELSYPFPALRADLGVDEYWSLGARSGHEGPRPSWPPSAGAARTADAHRGALRNDGGDFCFGQHYAYDFRVAKWSGSQWITKTGDQNADYFIWNKPVYSVSDGEVIYCHRTANDNSQPGTIDSLDPGVPGGGNILWIRHPGGEVALYAHLRQETIPTTLCPANGLQNPPIPVSRGDQLGLVGNSGNSGNPHLHFHIQDSWTDSPFERGHSLPVLFGNVTVGRPDTVLGQDWEAANEEAVASGDEMILIDIDD